MNFNILAIWAWFDKYLTIYKARVRPHAHHLCLNFIFVAFTFSGI